MSTAVPARRWAPYLLLEAATLLSATGNAVAGLALPWLVLERTGSAAAAGMVAAATALPIVVSGVFAGTLVDAFGRQRSAVLSDLLSLLSVAAIPLLDAAGTLTLAWIVALAALGAAFDPAGEAARETLIPAAAAAAGLRLERANSVHEALWGLAFLAGPAVAGVLLAVVGPVTTLWATAVGFAASVVLVGAIRLHVAASAVRMRPRELWRGTVEGLRFLWSNRLLRALGVLSLLLNAVYYPIEGVVLPVYFSALEQPARLGLLLATFAAGGVGGALAYGAWGLQLSRRWTFLAGFTGSAVSLLVLATLPSYPVMLVLGFLVGWCYGPVDPLINFAMQTRTPEALRGRVYSMLTSLAFAGGPMGYVAAGVLIEGVGLQAAFLLLTGTLVIASVSAVPLNVLRELDDEYVAPPG